MLLHRQYFGTLFCTYKRTPDCRLGMLGSRWLTLLYSFSALSGISASALPPRDVQLSFNIDTLRHAAAACQLTNCGDKENVLGTDLLGMKLTASIPYGGDLGQRVNIYTSDQFGIVVAYDGTNSTSAESKQRLSEFWLARPDPNLLLSPQSKVFSGVQTHFLRSWSVLQGPLTQVIRNNPGKKVTVTGFSLGGAICQLAALRILCQFGNIVDHVIPIAPPRVGNVYYANDIDAKFGNRFVAVINGQDWVPRLPPKLLGYTHASGTLWINPPNSRGYSYYPGREDPRGPAWTLPKNINYVNVLRGGVQGIPWNDHIGYYFGVHMGGDQGQCFSPLPVF